MKGGVMGKGKEEEISVSQRIIFIMVPVSIALIIIETPTFLPYFLSKILIGFDIEILREISSIIALLIFFIVFVWCWTSPKPPE
jgi:hypothetical protein